MQQLREKRHASFRHKFPMAAPPAAASAPLEDETSLPRIPDLTIANDAYLLSQPSYQGDKAKLKSELIAKIKLHSMKFNSYYTIFIYLLFSFFTDMVTYYESLAHQLGWQVDAQFVKEMNDAIAAKESQLDVRGRE